jgi:hypothetical protein
VDWRGEYFRFDDADQPKKDMWTNYGGNVPFEK